MKITILLADDHNVVRQGLRYLLESQPDFEIVGEASDGPQAIAAVERLKPLVTVLDLMMPGLNGILVTRRVATQTRVVILSMHNNEAYVVEALRSGAIGYVLKDSSGSDLITAVRCAAERRPFLSAPLSERTIEEYLQKAQSTPQDPLDTLTHRELEVLRLAAEGLTAGQISEQLGISPRTVEIHRANLMHKLDLHTQADLTRFALRKGIIPMEETGA